MDATRWDNLLRDRAAYESGATRTGPSPLEAFFEVAARCNLHCQMCAINYDARYLPGSKRPPFLTPELFAKLEPMFPRLVRAYLFGLGEPLLNRHLIDYIRTLSGYGVEVWFNTNATLIDEEKAEALASAGASAITVSIDGATRETYERIRVGARHDAVLRGIRALVHAAKIHGRPRVDLSFVGMASNLHELPDLIDLAADVGAGGVHVEPLYSQIQHDLQEHYARENLGLLGSERVDELFESARRRANERGVRLASRFLLGGGSADYVERAKQFEIWWTCNEAWTSIWVTSAGEVRTCCLNDTSFGDLFEQDFASIWNGPKFQTFRAEHAAGEGGPLSCRNCIRNGRVRHSPFLAPLEAVTYRPLRGRLEPPIPTADLEPDAILWPREGDTVTDPIAVLGKYSRRGAPPDLFLDRDMRIPIADCGVRSGGRFAATVVLPYLSEGAHLLSLRRPGQSRDIDLTTIHMWRPPGDGDGTAAIRAAGSLAIGRKLDRKSRTAHVDVDGGRWTKSRWLCGRTPEGWTGFATLDLTDLPPGAHTVSIHPAHHGPGTYVIDRLPSRHSSRDRVSGTWEPIAREAWRSPSTP